MKQLIVSVLVLLLVSAFAEAAPTEPAAKSLTVRTFQFKHKNAEQAATVIRNLRGIEPERHGHSASRRVSGRSLVEIQSDQRHDATI